MFRAILFLLFAVSAIAETAAPAPAPAAPSDKSASATRLENSPRHHEWVKLKRDGRTLEVFVAYPEVKDKATAVLVIHENRGLNDWARAFADHLAEKGYIAIAPDLLSGAGPNGGNTTSFSSTSDATRAIGQLDQAQVLGDLNAAADYVRTIDAANGKLAVVGFCWGGGQTWRIALARPGFVFAGSFYGPVPADADFSKLTAPIYGFYGGNDARVNATVEKATPGLKASGKTFEPVYYEGAGHAFMRALEEPDTNAANKVAAQASWERLLKLLAAVK